MSDIQLEMRPDGVAVITLDAPERRNSLTLDSARELVDACNAIDDNRLIGATIIRATGPTFCSGADRALLAQIAKDPASESNFERLLVIYSSFARVARMGTPTVIAVQGTALGAGLNLALSGDLCLLADDARLLSGFLPIRAHPGGGHFSLLSQRAGPQVAAGLSLFGVELVGAKAVEAGLAFEAWPSSQLDARALQLAAVAAADPELSRRAAASFRVELGLSHAQTRGSGVEHGPQLWSLRRRKLG